MKKNMGAVDRVIRAGIAGVIAIAYFSGAIDGAVAIVLGAIALVFVVTGIAGVCPLYAVLGISSCPRTQRT